VIYEKLHLLEAQKVGKLEDAMQGARDSDLFAVWSNSLKFHFNSRESSEYPGQDGSEDHIEHYATSN
jgi:hypothetical protein